MYTAAVPPSDKCLAADNMITYEVLFRTPRAQKARERGWEVAVMLVWCLVGCCWLERVATPPSGGEWGEKECESENLSSCKNTTKEFWVGA